MARPRKNITKKQLTQLEALAAFLTQDQIADYFGIAERTLRKRINDDPAVCAAYKKGRVQVLVGIAQGVINRAKKGDNACAFFYLKTQGGWKETSAHEHSGKDGGPVEVLVKRTVVQPDAVP